MSAGLHKLGFINTNQLRNGGYERPPVPNGTFGRARRFPLLTIPQTVQRGVVGYYAPSFPWEFLS
jgi:hypothetical protein